MESKELAYFMDACRRGDAAEVEQLCGLFPHLVNARDARQFTPLILAVYNNQPSVVAVLLQNGATIDAQDAAGNTALMGACFKGYEALAATLVEGGADVNLRNFQGAPALTFAATFGQLGIAGMLLKYGAVTDLPDSRGKTSLDHAVMQENEQMITLLQNGSESGV
jgi:ankyrin repeat protein